jgi:hypothetical protein
MFCCQPLSCQAMALTSGYVTRSDGASVRQYCFLAADWSAALILERETLLPG